MNIWLTFFPRGLEFDDLGIGGPGRFLTRHGLSPVVLEDREVRAHAAAVEVTHMLWREQAEAFHEHFSDGKCGG